MIQYYKPACPSVNQKQMKLKQERFQKVQLILMLKTANFLHSGLLLCTHIFSNSVIRNLILFSMPSLGQPILTEYRQLYRIHSVVNCSL